MLNLEKSLKTYVKKLDRKVERQQGYIDDLESRKEHLSGYGQWELGYRVGYQSALENTKDDLEELVQDSVNLCNWTSIYDPVKPSENEEVVLIHLDTKDIHVDRAVYRNRTYYKSDTADEIVNPQFWISIKSLIKQAGLI